MPGWAVALAVGVSLTRPSDLRLRTRAADAVFRRVRWSGQSLVAPPWYAVRVTVGGAALDYTHYKIVAATQDVVREEGTWHGERVADPVRLDARVQHFEVSHGVNALALVALLRDPARRGFYVALGPVLYLPHAESTVDGRPAGWGYGVGGLGVEAVAGVGDPRHHFAELKADAGRIAFGVADGSASTVLETVHAALSP